MSKDYKEWELGEERLDEGVPLKCIKGNFEGCGGCYFLQKSWDIQTCKYDHLEEGEKGFFECSSEYREDNTDVIFAISDEMS